MHFVELKRLTKKFLVDEIQIFNTHNFNYISCQPFIVQQIYEFISPLLYQINVDELRMLTECASRTSIRHFELMPVVPIVSTLNKNPQDRRASLLGKIANFLYISILQDSDIQVVLELSK